MNLNNAKSSSGEAVQQAVQLVTKNNKQVIRTCSILLKAVIMTVRVLLILSFRK